MGEGLLRETRQRSGQSLMATQEVGSKRGRATFTAASALPLRFKGQSTSVQNRLGVAIGLQGASKDEFASGLKGMTGVKVCRHRPVAGIRLILCVDHGRHSDEGLSYLAFAHNPMM